MESRTRANTTAGPGVILDLNLCGYQCKDRRGGGLQYIGKTIEYVYLRDRARRSACPSAFHPPSANSETVD
jgi:hypothetical protein